MSEHLSSTETFIENILNRVTVLMNGNILNTAVEDYRCVELGMDFHINPVFEGVVKTHVDYVVSVTYIKNGAPLGYICAPRDEELNVVAGFMATRFIDGEYYSDQVMFPQKDSLKRMHFMFSATPEEVVKECSKKFFMKEPMRMMFNDLSGKPAPYKRRIVDDITSADFYAFMAYRVAMNVNDYGKHFGHFYLPETILKEIVFRCFIAGDNEVNFVSAMVTAKEGRFPHIYGTFHIKGDQVHIKTAWYNDVKVLDKDNQPEQLVEIINKYIVIPGIKFYKHR